MNMKLSGIISGSPTLSAKIFASVQFLYIVRLKKLEADFLTFDYMAERERERDV